MASEHDLPFIPRNSCSTMKSIVHSITLIFLIALGATYAADLTCSLSSLPPTVYLITSPLEGAASGTSSVLEVPRNDKKMLALFSSRESAEALDGDWSESKVWHAAVRPNHRRRLHHRSSARGTWCPSLMQLTQELKAMARDAGCDLVGIADLQPFKSEQAAVPSDLLARFANAVSIAVHLDDTIIDGIEGVPTCAHQMPSSSKRLAH